MATLSVSVPDEMKAFVEKQTAERGFGSVNEYMNAVSGEERRRLAQDHLEQLLQEGLGSGPGCEMTDADWDQMRADLVARQRTAGGQ